MKAQLQTFSHFVLCDCTVVIKGFPVALVAKNPSASARHVRDIGLIPASGRPPGGGRAAHPVLLPGESHGQRSPAGCSPRGHQELDIAGQLSLNFFTDCTTQEWTLIQTWDFAWLWGVRVSPSVGTNVPSGRDVESAEACECVGMRGGNRNSLPFPLVLVF